MHILTFYEDVPRDSCTSSHFMKMCLPFYAHSQFYEDLSPTLFTSLSGYNLALCKAPTDTYESYSGSATHILNVTATALKLSATRVPLYFISGSILGYETK